MGTLGGWIGRTVRGDRPPREPTLADRLLGRLPRLPITAVAIVLVVGGCRFWVRWQNQQRQLLGMDPVSLSATIPMIVLTVVLTVVLAIIGAPARRRGPTGRPMIGDRSQAAVLGIFAATTVAGAALTWLRRRSGSIVAPMFAHLGTNGTTFALSWAAAR